MLVFATHGTLQILTVGAEIVANAAVFLDWQKTLVTKHVAGIFKKSNACMLKRTRFEFRR